MRNIAEQVNALLAAFFKEQTEVAKYAEATTEEMGADLLAVLDVTSSYAEKLAPEDNLFWGGLRLQKMGEWRWSFYKTQSIEHLYSPGEKEHRLEPCHYNAVASMFRDGLDTLLLKHDINRERKYADEMKEKHDILVKYITDAYKALNIKEDTTSAAK